MKQVPEVDQNGDMIHDKRSYASAANSSKHAIGVGERDLASTCGNLRYRYRYHTDDKMAGIESNWSIKYWASDMCGLDGMRPALLPMHPSSRVRREAGTSPPSDFVFRLEHGLPGVRRCVLEGGGAGYRV